MTRATNAGAQGEAGLFATSRRGGLSVAEIREIEAHRAKDRPTPWQALAQRYGRPETEIRDLFRKPDNDDEAAPAWPLGVCDEPVQNLIETVCRQYGVTPKDLVPNHANGKPGGAANMKALRASVSMVRAAFPALTIISLEALFLRDKSYIYNLLKQADAA